MIVLLAGVFGCGPGPLDKSTYMEHYAPAACRAQRECYQLYFNSYSADLEDCIDDLIDAYEDALDERYDDCEFDKKKAEGCIEATKTYAESCEYRDIEDECDEVWVCDNQTYSYGYYDY